MPRTRDYKAEYQRRIANATKRGLSRSQARGHARSGEALIRPRPAKDKEQLEAALKALRQTGNQASAAKSAGIAPERLRRFLRENALAERVGKRWRFNDQRPREMSVFVDGQFQTLTLKGFDDSSLAGRHFNAVGQFLESNDPRHLQPFVGRSITDASGVEHVLETDPNTLYRLEFERSGESYEQIYRLII